MRRAPSFAQRVNFPAGLRVLVLEPESGAAAHTCGELQACSYAPTCCSSAAEALGKLTTSQQSDMPFDLFLADADCLAGSASLQTATKLLPVVLTSQHSKEDHILTGIKRGAAAFLQKPLHQQALRNIWQHVVRRMMVAPVPCEGRRRRQVAQQQQDPAHAPVLQPHLEVGCEGASGNASAASPSLGACENSTSAGGGDSGGSLQSTTSKHEGVKHDEAHGPQAMPLGGGIMDPGLASLLDAADAALGNPLAGLASSFSSLFDDDTPPLQPAPLPALQRHASHNSGVHADLPAGPSAQAQQNQASRPPAIGQPAGQLPVAALTSPGMAWGLPCKPLQIMPKPGMVGMAPPLMPWMSPGMMMMPGMAMAAAASALIGQGAMCCPQGAAAAFAVPADLVASLDPDKAPKQPPIGLRLKKSSSLLDLLSRSTAAQHKPPAQ